MTNLLPRLQFRTPGLNRNVINTPNTTTPKDNGKIRERLPDPVKQSRASFTKNPQDQKKIHNSISLYNEHGTHTNTESLRSSNQRPRPRFPVITAVNQKRHTSCKVPIDPVEFSPGMTTYIQWQRSFIAQRNNMIFHNPEKPPGAKLNLYRAERTYSSKKFMELKRKQYMQRLSQNRRAFQGVHGNQEYIYMNYMRFINQSKTVPLPSKSGWRRPKWLPKSVTSGESTKDNSQKQRTTDKKAYSSSNVLQKSRSVQIENSKPEIKKQAKTEIKKRKSPKELLCTDQAVIVIKRPQRSKPSLLQSPNGPSISPTNSESQESKEKAEDVHSNGELKYSVEIGVEAESENSDKYLSSGDENQQRQPKHKEEVDIPMSLQGHVSPKGSIHETMQEEDQKSIDFKQRGSTDEMNKKSQEYVSSLSAVERPESRTNTLSNVHEKLQEEDKKSNYFEHREYAIEMKSQENDSPPLEAESPESGKSTSSKVKENLQEEEEQLTYFEQSEYVDEMNKKNQEYLQLLATESPESGKGTSSKVHEKLQEDQKSTDLEQRESADEINKKSQEHDSHPSTLGRSESGKNNSTSVYEMIQEDDQKSTGLEQRKSADELNKKSHEHSSHSSTVERPISRKDKSTNVHEKLKEDQKSIEPEQRESADEMDRKNQEHEMTPASPAEKPDSTKKTSNEVHDNDNLEDEDQKSTDLEQSEAADDLNKKSQEHDFRPSTAERPESGKSTSSECKDPQTQASINGVEDNKT